MLLTRSTYEPSTEAIEIYWTMVEHMDRKTGYVDLSDCMRITADEVDRLGGLADLNTRVAELARGSLAFPDEQRGGWVVRLPVAQQL